MRTSVLVGFMLVADAVGHASGWTLSGDGTLVAGVALGWAFTLDWAYLVSRKAA